MQPTLCARCKKNVAVIFITKIENGVSTNEGLCLKCAKELNIQPVDDIMKKMGISEEELDSISNDMMEAFGGAENLQHIEDGDDSDGKTATFPFLNKLYGGQDGQQQPMEPPRQPRETKERGESRTLDVASVGEEGHHIVRVIDKDGMYYSVNGLTLSDGCALYFREGESPMEYYVEVVDADGETVGTYKMFAAAL